jgi:phosphate transport system protein
MVQDARHFGEELQELKARLLVMGGLAEERVHKATRGLIERDRQLIQQVIDGDEPLNTLQIEIDDRCFKLLALHQPTAIDLRTIVAIVKINSDLERVGDLAVNIAEVARRFVTHPSIKALGKGKEMAALAEEMLHNALEAFVGQQPEVAKHVLAQDDVLDELRDQTFRDILDGMLRDPATIEAGVDLILVARHLERIGDHATNISEDVIFIAEARDVRHHSIDRSL